MDTAIIVSIISSMCTLVGVIITVRASARKQRIELELQQRYQQHEIEEIKSQLKTHNNYAGEIPVIQTEIKYISESISEIKKRIGA